VPKRIERGVLSPVIVSFTNCSDDSKNSTITPANIGKITGKRLGFNKEEADAGLFFISTDDQSEHKCSVVSRNMPSEMQFLIPAELTAGSYTLVLKNRPKSDKLVVTAFDYELTVL
jgi:hypothetical protein